MEIFEVSPEPATVIVCVADGEPIHALNADKLPVIVITLDIVLIDAVTVALVLDKQLVIVFLAWA